ncbi:acetyl-CoA C-acyltransferase [Algicola sagamiensis]|uniref:acetyl-CoA C-acyltransferase n=1 Tax=Algicola sagamiensis TaxID=163869 RepID=UPI0003781D40|nr:acetyl-CoA C-acyltransferase [Algicola sagamiensis]
MENQDPVVIVAAKRTPMGGFMGELQPKQATELGGEAIAAALQYASIQPSDIDEVIMGCVLPAGLKQAPARQAMIKAGVSVSTGATTINKVCGSGMKAAMLAHDLIRAGSVDIVVAGGMESMTNAPHLLSGSRSGQKMGAMQMMDHMMTDGLEDAYEGGAMGCFAQATADEYKMTRSDMDDFAISSLKKAQQAIENGWFKEEITPVTIQARKGDITIDTDEQPGKARIDKIPSLRPAFAKEGTITAANSSSISDGAAALILMRESEAQKRGLTPLCRIVGHSTHSQEPASFTTAPVGAIRHLLEKIHWNTGDVDLYEINEAFAMVTMLAIQELSLDETSVNVHGGACALGHPIGASGARILVTLIHALKQKNLKRGVASLCIGGGEATAIAIEMMA